MKTASQLKILSVVLLVAVGACDGPTNLPPLDTGAQPGSPITTFPEPASAGCPIVRPKSVLVDATHDGGVWWFPQAPSQPSGFNPDSAHQGGALANYLRAQGFTVTELGRGATMPADSMLTYATVIRASYYYDIVRPGYSAADLAAYAAYTSCDRTLILLGEYLRDGQKDDLAEAYGIALAGIETGSISTFSAHALTAGVSSVPYIAGSVLASESNPAIQVLGRLANGKAAMGLLTLPNAKLFWIGDMNGIQQLPQPFVANLVAWGFR
jgi:hypothetical protein